MKNKTKEEIIKIFDLQPHPEGGFYKETYRSGELIEIKSKPRNISTAIFYLLEGKDYSAFHRIKSDEIWHFYSGEPLEIVEITTEGLLKKHLLGSDYKTCKPQIIIPAGSWFGARIPDKKGWAFVGCTVAPGFDFEDFEMAERIDLTKKYPEFEDIIIKLTRE